MLKVYNVICYSLNITVYSIWLLLHYVVIIFGGGMSKSGDILLKLVNMYIKKRTWTILPTDVKLMISTTPQEEAGIIGTALAIKNHLNVLENGKKLSLGVLKPQESKVYRITFESYI